jgi:hypothetical protein
MFAGLLDAVEPVGGLEQPPLRFFARYYLRVAEEGY